MAKKEKSVAALPAPEIRRTVQPDRDGERKDAPDHIFRQTKGRRYVVRQAPFLHQPGEGFPLGDLIGIEAGDIFDQRGFDGIGIVAVIEDRTGQQGYFRTGRFAFCRDDFGGMEAPRAADDFERAVRTSFDTLRTGIGSHDQRLDDPALADGRQDIGHIGCLFRIAHVGFADTELVQRDKIEFHVPSP